MKEDILAELRKVLYKMIEDRHCDEDFRTDEEVDEEKKEMDCLILSTISKVLEEVKKKLPKIQDTKSKELGVNFPEIYGYNAYRKEVLQLLDTIIKKYQ